MSRRISVVRSNLFRVKDMRAFENLCMVWKLKPVTGKAGRMDFFLFPEEMEGVEMQGLRGQGVSVFNPEPNGRKRGQAEADFMAELSVNLLPPWVAVVYEVVIKADGSFVAMAAAVASDGNRSVMDLNDFGPWLGEAVGRMPGPAHSPTDGRWVAAGRGPASNI